MVLIGHLFCGGGVNGIALCIDKLKRRVNNKVGITKWINVLVTFIFISFTWIFFRADSFTTAGRVIKGIFTLQNGIQHLYIWSIISIVILLFSTLLAEIKAHKNKTETTGYYPILNLNSVGGLVIFFVEIGIIIALAYTGENPFVYFQF